MAKGSAVSTPSVQERAIAELGKRTAGGDADVSLSVGGDNTVDEDDSPRKAPSRVQSRTQASLMKVGSITLA
jgi:hypothetical protein